MDQDFLQILNMTDAAAAVLRDGIAVWCSDHARRLGLEPGADVQSLLPEGVSVDGGAQMFTMPSLGERVSARLSPMGEMTVLILRDGAEPLTTDALGQISRVLNGPIEDILFTGRTLFERLEALEDPSIQAETARLTRNFYRLLRTSNALLDQYGSVHDEVFAPERADVRRWLREMADRLCAAVASAGRTLDITLPERHLYVPADTVLLEQALLGLLSNAIRFSPEGSRITLNAGEKSGQCLINLCNELSGPVSFPDLSGAFTRPIGPEDQGLGLGLRRVQQIALLHGGTVVLQCIPDGRFSATLCIPTRRADEALHTPAAPVDRTGGYDRLLVELADVLPDEVFDSRNL